MGVRIGWRVAALHAPLRGEQVSKMNEHDKKEIQKLIRIKQNILKDRALNLTKEEKINRFLKAMRGEK